MRPVPAVSITDDAKIDGPTDLLGDLYRRYSRWLEAMVRRNGGGDGAEDIVQETYLRLSKYPAGTHIRHPQALLMRVASNVMRNAARRERALKRTDQAAFAVVDNYTEADQLEQVAFTEAVLALPETYRDIFLLSRFSGMSNLQIARHCNLTVKAVEWRLSKALTLCDAHLRAREP